MNAINSKRRRKIELVKHFGSKCVKCGYSKCLSALTFHHRDPESKEFELSRRGKSLAKLIVEAEKCDLLCANCHAEIHDEYVDML